MAEKTTPTITVVQKHLYPEFFVRGDRETLDTLYGAMLQRSWVAGDVMLLRDYPGRIFNRQVLDVMLDAATDLGIEVERRRQYSNGGEADL